MIYGIICVIKKSAKIKIFRIRQYFSALLREFLKDIFETLGLFLQ